MSAGVFKIILLQLPPKQPSHRELSSRVAEAVAPGGAIRRLIEKDYSSSLLFLFITIVTTPALAAFYYCPRVILYMPEKSVQCREIKQRGGFLKDSASQLI